MPHPTLTELVKQLQQAVSNNQNQHVLVDIGNEISRRILTKHNRLSTREAIYDLQNWAGLVQNAPDQIDTFVHDPDFIIIQKRDVDIINHFSQSNQSLFSNQYQINLDVICFSKRMIFENPHIALETNYTSIQSWSRPKSISNIYGRHLPTSRYRRKSRFLLGINIKDLEYQLFQHAYGVLESENRIFFYGIFSNNVGVLPPQHNINTNIVKMQCDRVRRQRGTGFRVEFHGYPISQNELQRDFYRNNHFLNLIQNNIFQL